MNLAPTTGQHIAQPSSLSTVLCSIIFGFHGLKLMRNSLANFRRVSEIARSEYQLLHVCPPVRPSVLLELLGSHWTDFNEVWFLSIFRKSADKIQVSLKSDKNISTAHQDQRALVIISRSVLLRMGNVSDKSCRESQDTYFIFNKFFFFRKSCHSWDNLENYIAEPGRSQTKIWGMRFAFWIYKATNTRGSQ